MNIEEQIGLHNKALSILEMIEKEERYTKSLEELLDSRTEELYPGQHDYNRGQVNIKKKASKRLKESYSRIIKEISNEKD